jgi:hypothetical protein
MNQHELYLFIVKKHYDYDGKQHPSSGVLSSVQFVVDMLNAQGLRALMVTAEDGNSIDALVAQYRPVAVVLEAIWVTPAKMAELMHLHPKVRWTVRAHSEIAFLAQEGCAVEWLAAFNRLGIEVAFNSEQTAQDWAAVPGLGRAAWLPNYYLLRQARKPLEHAAALHVGCFGAIRPFKNQLIQAMAAAAFAAQHRRPLVFHMNGDRVEQFGQSNLKNIQAALKAAGATLVLHPWQGHAEFLELIAQMEVCMQVSLTESFNIVSADAVSMGVPLVGSSAITWLPRFSQAPTGDVHGIVEAMDRAGRISVFINHEALEDYLCEARKVWMRWAA